MNSPRTGLRVKRWTDGRCLKRHDREFVRIEKLALKLAVPPTNYYPPEDYMVLSIRRPFAVCAIWFIHSFVVSSLEFAEFTRPLQQRAVQCHGQGIEDQGQGPALSPEESEKRFLVAEGLQWTRLLSEPVVEQPLMSTFDSKGRLWVVEYRQYPEPAGLKALSRDNFWRIVYDTMPLPPGKGGVPGKDRISIHEDKDQNGTYESHSVFVEGLNIATAVVPVENGAWVLNPPYLLFYHDTDQDSKADGAPEVHLQGFGLEDTHSVVNSLCMGPDGWLYAAQGSTVSGSIQRYLSDDPPKKILGQAIWRYHPQTRQYEVFAEGGGNAFGVAMNDQGEIFSGHNGGDTRGFHYYQGGYYRKGFSKHGSLSNPFAFGYLNPMQHPPIQRFTHTMLLTEGTAFHKANPDAMIAVDPLHGKLIQTDLQPNGSTYKTKDNVDFLSSHDKWFRPVAIADGPDGAAYVCDWYDFQVAHLYAHQGKMDRDHGRVYRLAPSIQVSADLPEKSIDSPSGSAISKWDPIVANGTDLESLNYLFSRLEHPYRWQRWMARRLISIHPMKLSVRQQVLDRISLKSFPIEYLWTAHVCGWLGDTNSGSSNATQSPVPYFDHFHPAVRAWAIRITSDDHEVSSEVAEAIVRRAEIESDPKVLCQIACSAKRLPVDTCLSIVAALLSRSLPSDDPFLPLLIWWAVEAHGDHEEAITRVLLMDEQYWSNPIARDIVFPNLVRRWMSIKSERSVTACTHLLNQVNTLKGELRTATIPNVQAAFEKAFEGKSLSGLDDDLLQSLIQLGQPAITLRLRRGDVAAIKDAAEVLLDRKAKVAVRIQIARVISELTPSDSLEKLIPVMLEVVSRDNDDLQVRDASLAALSVFNQPSIGKEVIAIWNELPDSIKSAAGALLASRSTWAKDWLSACNEKKVDSSQLPLEAIRAMRQHSDQAIQKQLDRFYPETAGLDLATVQKRVDLISEVVLHGSGDPYKGKKQFETLCARCHKLFENGGELGPDLTGYQRDQLPSLLRNVLAPSLEIREGYRTVQLLTDDGRVLSGFIESQTDEQMIVRTIDGLSHLIDRSDVDSVKPQLQSLMPEGLLDKLTPQEIVDLISYLRSSQPLSDG